MSGFGVWEEREPGARRKKIAGYLRAANELRQTYQQSYKESWTNRGLQHDGTAEIPGSYPGSSVTSNSDAQLILFPSYARHHVRQKPEAAPGTIQQVANYGRDVRDTAGFGDTDSWQQEWEKYENDRAIVDVDIRGWIFMPQKGPLSRRNKVVMAAARQLSGIPAPQTSPSSSTAASRSDSPVGFRDRINAHSAHHQEELARREAETVIRRGEAEAAIASQGGYSEDPGHSRNHTSESGSDVPSREDSPDRFRDDFALHRRNQVWSDQGDRRGAVGVAPSRMSQVEIAAANANLMQRLAPFMATACQNISISAFFYNDDDSVMRNIETDTSGHFSLRAPLEFVPTHVRILASDKMSATEPVRVVDPRGVSVISDIDDTIKHTAISNGSKEIFRNVFVRDVSELSIEGVRNWYNNMASLGCEFHYVSNSPWQLYRLLAMFFQHAGLPPGSFHLKAYSGMLQGIFEPVAERKKATIDKLMSDFPDRRFILVGDSGEADLEVYRDTVLQYPGRVLGVFIRDVTTTKKHDFFDPTEAMGNLRDTNAFMKPKPRGREPAPVVSSRGTTPQEDAEMREAIARSLADVGPPPETLERSLSRHEKTSNRSSPARPPLPPRQPTAPAAPEENLIDLDSDKEEDNDPGKLPKSWLRPPPTPSKPRSLSSNRIETFPSEQANGEASVTETSTKTPPPRPRKPSTSVNMAPPKSSSEKPPPLPLHSKPGPNTPLNSKNIPPAKPPRPDPPPPRQSYRVAARQRITDAYNRMPSPKDMVFGSRPGTPKSSPSHSRAGSFAESTSGKHSREPSLADLIDEERGPPVPPRKPTAMQASSSDTKSSWSESLAYGSDPSIRHGSTASTYSTYSPSHGLVLNKKEIAWQERWNDARRQLEPRGVLLRNWRVGDDAQPDAMKLIRDALKEDERRRRDPRR